MTQYSLLLWTPLRCDSGLVICFWLMKIEESLKAFQIKVLKSKREKKEIPLIGLLPLIFNRFRILEITKNEDLWRDFEFKKKVKAS